MAVASELLKWRWVMRRVVLIALALCFCLAALPGCGKDAPAVKTEAEIKPKNRLPATPDDPKAGKPKS